MIALELPWPPSVNRYWRLHRQRGYLYISPAGRQYRATVGKEMLAQGVKRPLEGPLRVGLRLFPPSRRKHDIDNLLKAVFDALEHAGAYHDDNQIAELYMVRPGQLGGFIEAYIEPAPEARLPWEWSKAA